MLGMKNHFDISDSIEICEVDIARVTCKCAGFEGSNGPKCTIMTAFLGVSSWPSTSHFTRKKKTEKVDF